MQFCPKCGTRLVPKKSKDEGAKIVLSCPKCGFSKRQPVKEVELTPKVIEHGPQETIAVISKEDQQLRVLPTLCVECPKCGNNQAYVWQVQTRGGDDPATQFFRCTKCNHTFREYS